MCLKSGLRAAVLGGAVAIALLGCADDPQPMPSVTLTPDATTVALGQRVTLTWTTRHATSCTAEGAWSGSKAANGSESVAVPLTQARNTFGLACTRGSRTARAEVVVTIGPPRFSMQELPLNMAIDLNDAGDVLGYREFMRDPVVWTRAGMLRVDVGGPWCPPGGTVDPYWVSAINLNNARNVLVRVHWGPGLDTSCLVALGSQPLSGGELPIDEPRALNDSVQVVGRGYSGSQLGVPPPRNEAVLLSSGQATIVQPIRGQAGTATVINDAGVVAGHYEIAAAGPVHLFRYENGVTTDLGTSAAGGFPMPLGINAAGTIVGVLELPEGSAGEHLAFRVRGGGSALEALPDLGGRWSMALDVNDLEQVVGTSALPGAPDAWRATLLSAGTLYDLNDLVVAAGGITLTDGGRVNGAGQVLAHGCDAEGENCRPYLLTPIEAR